jgi:hypothetical protein
VLERFSANHCPLSLLEDPKLTSKLRVSSKLFPTKASSSTQKDNNRAGNIFYVSTKRDRISVAVLHVDKTKDKRRILE